MQFPAHIFRSYDIRGLLDEVTPQLAEAVGRALVKKTGAKTVMVGRDMRHTSPVLAEAAIKGITDAGASVLDIGMCSKSLFNFAVTGEFGADAGIMITASHNPTQYNGIKVSLHSGVPITGTEVFALLQEEGWATFMSDTKGSVRSLEVLNAYVSKCKDWESVDMLRGMKIVVDYGNGMGALAFKPLCERLGIETTELYAEPDASFPNHEANPANFETLHELSKQVVALGADFGVAFDGDADRIGFVDNAGEPMTGDVILAALAADYLPKHPGSKVILCVNQSWATKDAIDEHGGEVIWSPIGWTKVSKLMRDSGAALAAEYSGHVYYPHFSCLEAVDHTFIRMAIAYKHSGKTFAEFVQPHRAYARTGEINIEMENKQGAIDALRAKYVVEATNVSEIDGVRCEFNHDWWFLSRPSNTEPVLRVSIEAKDEQLLAEKREEILAVVAPFMHH